VQDYHHQAMTAKIIPMFLQYNVEGLRLVHIKLFDVNDDQGTMAIESAFSSVNPDLKTTYKPFQEELTEFYDLMFGDLKKMVGVASVLALVIACLGLLGMATYTVETRLKEVSIRKILGATDGQLVYQLSRGFLILIVVAIVISTPIAYLLNNLWLELIAYRVEITFGIIASGASILVLFGLLTIGSQTYRAGSVAPIDNLRSE
jgi:putative ABC transport system permease protein